MRRPSTAAGFSFLEVLMALSALLVGSVAILSLFAVGAHHMVQRRITARYAQVRSEVEVVLQDALDRAKPGELPPAIRGLDLSEREYALDAEFRPSPFGGDRAVALAVVLFRGTPARVLPPVFLTRSTLDPR